MRMIQMKMRLVHNFNNKKYKQYIKKKINF